MSRIEKAKNYFLQGYACSQAVALSFADLLNLDEQTIAKATLPFGGGMGRLRLTCGALSGMAFVVGLLYSQADNSPENKKNIYAIVQELCGKFQEKYGTLLCGDLLKGMQVPVEVGGVAEARTKEYYQKRSCADIVADVTQILEEYIQTH